jgi:hypothetical protein
MEGNGVKGGHNLMVLLCFALLCFALLCFALLVCLFYLFMECDVM